MIEYHSDYGHNRQIAINVKDYYTYANHPNYADAYSRLPESTINACYEQAREYFWDRARDISHEYGYGDVYSEGRSDGWLVVENPPNVDSLTQINQWVKFQTAIENAIEDCREAFSDSLEFELNERVDPLCRVYAQEDLVSVGL